MSDTAAAKAPTEKAPLFYWNGVKEAEGERLQPVRYQYEDMPALPVGTITVTSLTGEDFSAKVRRYFDVEPLYILPEGEGTGGYGRFYVTPSHPLYPQVKAAADTYTVPARFTKIRNANGDHIITRDNHTGLEWASRNIGEYTNSEAEKARRKLRLGDHTDWRVPTAYELISLIDRSRHNPAIDTDAFPSFCSSDSRDFLTSTLNDEFPDFVWVVDFYKGSWKSVTCEKRLNVLPVRGSLNRILRGGA